MAGAAQDAAVATFTRWVNARLRAKEIEITSIATDFQDGVKLIYLLEALTKQPFSSKWNQKPKGPLQALENCKLAVSYIMDEMGIKMVGIGGEDVNKGHVHLTLAMIWHLILRYQVGMSVEGIISEKESAEQALLKWAREAASKVGVPIDDFTGSWADGRGFAALVSNFFPDVLKWPPEGDAEAVFATFSGACKDLGIEVFLEASDLTRSPQPDKQVIMTQVAELCSFFADSGKMGEAQQKLQRVADINARLDKLVEESSGEAKSALEALRSTLNGLTATGLKYCALCGEIFGVVERLLQLILSGAETVKVIEAAKAAVEGDLSGAQERIREVEATEASLQEQLAQAGVAATAQEERIAELQKNAATQAEELAAVKEVEGAEREKIAEQEKELEKAAARVSMLEAQVEQLKVKPLRYRWGAFTVEIADAIKGEYVARFGGAPCRSVTDFVELFTDYGVNLEHWDLLFRLMDSDGSGSIDRLELFSLLDLLVGVNLRDPDAQGWSLFKMVNADHSGLLSAAELARFLEAAGRKGMRDLIIGKLDAKKKTGLKFGELWPFLVDDLGLSPSEAERILRALGGFGWRPVRTASDLAYRLTNCGWDIREQGCVGLFKLCDRDGNNVLEAQEFLLLLSELDRVDLGDAAALDRVMFRVLDVDENGVLDAGELAHYSDCVGVPLARPVIEQYLKAEGKTGLSYDEFVGFQPAVVRAAAEQAAAVGGKKWWRGKK